MRSIKNATIIPVLDAFCPEEVCLVFDAQGMPLYYDDDHLSSFTGGKFLVGKVLKPYLEAPSR